MRMARCTRRGRRRIKLHPNRIQRIPHKLRLGHPALQLRNMQIRIQQQQRIRDGVYDRGVAEKGARVAFPVAPGKLV